jgi:predicted amidophosphoribosyltransferase
MSGRCRGCCRLTRITETVVFSAAELRLCIAEWRRCAVDFVFPPQCPLCGLELQRFGSDAERDAIANVCPACVQEVAPPPGDRCRRCCAPVGPHLDTSAGCIHCIGDPYAFERVYALGVYRDRLRTAVLSAKQEGGVAAAAALAHMFCEREQVEMQALHIDAVVPVPHHWLERVGRRHLTPVTLSRVIAARLQTRWRGDALKKIRLTPKQASLTPTGRRSNLPHRYTQIGGFV